MSNEIENTVPPEDLDMPTSPEDVRYVLVNRTGAMVTVPVELTVGEETVKDFVFCQPAGRPRLPANAVVPSKFLRENPGVLVVQVPAPEQPTT